MISGILHNKLILIVVILIVLGGGWYGLSSGPSDSTGALTSTDSSVHEDASLVATLLALRAIKLDSTIFSNPAFIGLKDLTTAIVPEPVGRPDPFAPLPGVVVPNKSATQSGRIFQSGK